MRYFWGNRERKKIMYIPFCMCISVNINKFIDFINLIMILTKNYTLLNLLFNLNLLFIKFHF